MVRGGEILKKDLDKVPFMSSRASEVLSAVKLIKKRTDVNINIAQRKGNNMNSMKRHIEILGMRVADKVTGFAGVATSISFDLYGCIQVLVNPGIGADGKLGELIWFDVSRINVSSDSPVMDIPDFESGYVSDGLKGPEEKPTGCVY